MAQLIVSVERTSTADLGGALVAVFRFQDEAAPAGGLAALDGVLDGSLTRVLGRGDFRGCRDESLIIHSTGERGPDRVLLVGLGKRDAFSAQVLRRAVGTAMRAAERARVATLSILLDGLATGDGGERNALATIEAAVMGAWDWRDLKTVPPDPPAARVDAVRLVALDEAQEAALRRALRAGEAGGRAANFARELAIRPGNVVTPSYLADSAASVASRFGMKLTVLDRAAMEREGLKALLAVAQGSQEEPRFIVLEHRAGKGGQPLVLIGKGVTFDSGGISIKPADRMEDMKFDMSGAAGVLGAMQGLAELGVGADVIALVPSTENMPSGTAVKPGDVIGSLLGKSIEVVNTDAEGRLILADALAWAKRYEPAAIIDAATLTGAVGIALGHHAIGLMGNDETLIEQVRQAGERSGERCWPLPLWDDYRPQIDSPVADLKNTGGRPAGTITAGWFLKEFAGDVPWVHLDIAATAYRDEPQPYLRKGPTGVPARLLMEWVRGRVAE